MAKKGKQYVYWLIWLGFVLFLLYQHSLVWMHIDDFGYASLNYAVNVGTVGNDYTVADVFKYLYLHYMEWGGRVLFYGIAIFIYHFCGLQGIRITQALIIFGIYYLAFHIITKEAKIERVMKRDRLNAKEAKEKIKKVEQERSNHCYYFTHKHWKDLDNYDFYLKSDFLGIDASINLLSDMIERREIK